MKREEDDEHIGRAQTACAARCRVFIGTCHAHAALSGPEDAVHRNVADGFVHAQCRLSIPFGWSVKNQTRQAKTNKQKRRSVDSSEEDVVVASGTHPLKL